MTDTTTTKAMITPRLLLTALLTALLLTACGGSGAKFTDSGTPLPFPRADGPIQRQDGGPQPTPQGSFKVCKNDNECSGTYFKCKVTNTATTGMCSHSCTTNNDCAPGFACITGTTVGLSASCAQLCTATSSCPTGMICATLSDGVKACIPDGWAISGCSSGAQKCSGTNLSVCKSGAWQTESCDLLCMQAGYGKATGCQFDPAKSLEVCICGPAGCQSGQQQCSGLSLGVCQSGTWNVQTCDALCKQGGMGKPQICKYDPTKGTDSCFCYGGLLGDPCASQADCKVGTCGAGGWCTTFCASDSDCGSNTLNSKNYCLETGQAGTYVCFPWCSSQTTCTEFPGTTCQKNVVTKDGKQVLGVCSF
jgi:hypothetical protein